MFSAICVASHRVDVVHAHLNQLREVAALRPQKGGLTGDETSRFVDSLQAQKAAPRITARWVA